MNLTYRSFVSVEDLTPNECTIRRASRQDGSAKFWNLWFYVARETDGVLEAFVVPVIPNGVYTESGPGGRSWGLNHSSPDTWQISPSINVLNDDDARRVQVGESPTGQSLWHQTPAVVGVPDGEAWITGQP
jgi:hypothetical protein